MTVQTPHRVGKTLTLVVVATYCVLMCLLLLRKRKVDDTAGQTPVTFPTDAVTTSRVLPAFDTGPRRFDFPINEPRLCAADEYSNPSVPFLLITVQSHASNKLARDAIRDTWGRISRDFFRKTPVRIVFILGAVHGTVQRNKIKKESASYRDLISADFVDTYRNLSLKSLASFYWARQFCLRAKYLLKTDDNMYHNVTTLMRWLEMENTTITGGIVGRLHINSTVYRYGPWKLDESLYPSRIYPPYCAGCAYLVSLSMAGRLLEASQRVPLLPIEDVYITGLLARAVGTQCSNNFRFSEWNNGPMSDNICAMVSGNTFSVHHVDHWRMYAIHRNSQTPEWCKENEIPKQRYSNSRHLTQNKTTL
ncbi:hypothetical protein NP493_85g04033 [Ridgeia piscesae]|uniref:Hexosyltransferase n=1 Tax=Ridgeia piscesae TaxID=27915 RepID=A0AAD9P976_RIDPI|nr:hypothetical protein NP493_85g04033 [Ridgeia piscesae]